MLCKGCMPCENFTTFITFIELFSSMNSLMFDKEGVATESFTAFITFIGGFGTYSSVLWRSRSHIYGVSEGQWRLLPGTARPLCRQVNCRNSLLLNQEAPKRLVNLDTEVLNWNPQSIFIQEFWSGWGKPQCTSFLLPQYYWIEELLLLVKRFIHSLLPTSYLKALRISSGVY